VSRVPSALFLDPVPEAARAARAHVQHALDGLQLQHLSEAAELGTSELVTNAVLHARTSIRLTVVRTPTGVRIEVGDDSTVEPRSLIGRDRADSEHIASVGRGLVLLEALGRWGVRVQDGDQPGKVVWFEPAPETSEHPESAVDAGSPPSATADAPVSAATEPERPPPDDAAAALGRYDRHSDSSLVEVRLLRFPLVVFHRARLHHDELIREFTLLALQDGGVDAATVPKRLVELIEILGRRYRPTAERGHVLRDEAAARGDLSIDLTYHVPAAVRATLLDLHALMEDADLLAEQGELLTVPPSDLVRDFRRWYIAQFLDQMDGKPPSPWPGPLH
jgi:anti-sigma regulatory factor (Ser/Thr protein kinase)